MKKVHEGTLKLEYLYFKTIAEKSGVVYHLDGDKTVKYIYPGEPIPENIKPGMVPEFRMMSRRERRGNGRG